jgi:deaminated glutathione amidase
MATFTVAVLQLEIARGDNLARMRAEIESVVARTPWVQMVVLGELSVFGSGTDRAEPPAGPIEREFCRIAAALRLWLLPGSLYVRHDDGQVFNTIPVINPAGEVVARHRKMFPFLPYETGVAPGTDFVVFDIPKCGRIGVSNCYDMWFPETTRTLAAMGAEVILHPSMTNTIDRDVELAIARASAAINQCYFIDVNVAGPLDCMRTGRRSDPPGWPGSRGLSGGGGLRLRAPRAQAWLAGRGAGAQELSRPRGRLPGLRRSRHGVRGTAGTGPIVTT